jgi:hypothetical protein
VPDQKGRSKGPKSCVKGYHLVDTDTTGGTKCVPDQKSRKGMRKAGGNSE